MTQTLVTGGSGFIGQHLVAALLAQGCRVRVLDLRPPSYAGAGAQYVKGSILDAELVHKALDGVAEVYHLAALPGMWTRCKTIFMPSIAVAQKLCWRPRANAAFRDFCTARTKSILFGSSPLKLFVIDHVGTTPDEMPGVYTRSKLLAEQRALQAAASGFPVVIANPTMPIGPHYGNLTPPTLMLLYFINRRVQVYFDFVLNLVDVRDVAAGLHLAMERGQSGHRYILGGDAISLSKLLRAVGAITGRKALRVPIPAGIAGRRPQSWNWCGLVTHRPPAGTVEGVRIALRSQPLSIESARRDLGYAPNPIGPALRETVASLVGRPGKFDKLVGSHW